MTTIELPGYPDESPTTNRFTVGLLETAASIGRWHTRRRTLAALSHLDPHMRRDAGVAPADPDYPLSGSAAVQLARLYLNPVAR
jgi:uncharacterized protein YjiS (DUF1127 family)